MKNIQSAVLGLALLLASCSHTPEGLIRVNQVGFSPTQEKTATLEAKDAQTEPQEVVISNALTGEEVWRGMAAETLLNPISGKARQVVDFSDLTTPGDYVITCGKSENRFSISESPYHELTRKALRAFFFQRASMSIEEPYAEEWARPAGHPDDHVLVHASAATDERPEGTVLSCPGGWYDAGDYNKYIVNSGYTIGVMLMAYEAAEDYFSYFQLNIPESDNNVPDLLDEAMYNIRWMLTMQDLDGGVYHKLTEASFEGFLEPKDCRKQRYVVQKTTAATLDFAASMALAARVYAPYEKDFPGFCQQATEAAQKAYEWAKSNPEVYYRQDEMNQQYEPAVTTGAYPDNAVTDEFFWAASELYRLTENTCYQNDALAYYEAIWRDGYTPSVWGDVAELAKLEDMSNCTDSNFFCLLEEYLRPYVEEAETSVHRSPYGNRETDFFWGCNAEGCAWRGIQMLYAYRQTGEKKYLINARRCLNHILGQNATGYCYVTGFGTKPSEHPHHRLTTCYKKAIPGFMTGGPNPGQQDRNEGMTYPDDITADECYLDLRGSYATNEIAINWNVTLFALAGWLDALSAL